MSNLVNSIFSILSEIDRFFWSYIGFFILFISGIYLTILTKGFQFRVIFSFKKCIKDLLKSGRSRSSRGIHPLRLYFASVSGMVGLGNIVGIVTAVTIGGPGALFWVFIGMFPSMLVKYSEIYLGIRYRVANKDGGYDGGPMFYLKKAFKNSYIPTIVSVLLCIYGIEIFQFSVVADVVSYTFNIEKIVVIVILLGLVLYTVLGGVRRLSQIGTLFMPIFILFYLFMCLWVIGCRISVLPSALLTVLKSAFSGHAAVGGFAGSTAILAMQQGISKAVYSGDIGIGYDSIIQAETMALLPQQQARLGIFSLLTDTLVCLFSMLVVLVTNVWFMDIEPSKRVPTALGMFFPRIDIFMAIFLTIAGFTTIVAYITVGVKSAEHLGGPKAKLFYIILAMIMFISFSFLAQQKALLVMSISAGILVMFNTCGILKLRNFIKFE